MTVMPPASRMRRPQRAEAEAMDDPEAARPARKRAAARKPAAPRKRLAAKSKPAAPEPQPAVAQAAAPPRRRRRRAALVLALLVLATAAAAAAAFLWLAGDDAAPDVRAGRPVSVSADELASYAEETDTTVYWAGAIPSRELELTATKAGTYVRYLSSGYEVGDERRALTIATYPLPNAFATATARAGNAQMASARTPGGGLAVWSRARPTSVYVAFPEVGQLIEVYSPKSGEATDLARSGDITPVR
jgi:hypothetical protein